MNCIRCGKETEDKAVFCPECLENMAQYPVKPGTIIHIPQRQDPANLKQTKKKRELSAEEQLNNAQNLIQLLIVALLAMLSALIITGAILVYVISNPIRQPVAEYPQGYVVSDTANFNTAEQ